jgi:hypothetical protein
MTPELTQEETNRALASAPGTVTVGDKTYLVDKFTTATVFSVYEWGTEAAHRAYNPFREVAEALKDLETAGLAPAPEDRTALLAQAHRVKVAGEVPGDLITKCLRGREGVAFTLWVLTRNHHPELTYESCKGLITDDNRLDVYVQLDVASGANIVNKAVMSAGFFPQALPVANPGSSPTAAVPLEPTSTRT